MRFRSATDRRNEARELAEWRQRGLTFAQRWPAAGGRSLGDPDNPLRGFFNAHTKGRGIWKWDHYFDAYHRHFERFRGTEVRILEIGIYSGGSLDMWRDYFGAGCHVYGVDIQEECRLYESDSTTIFIGDQGNRDFWRHFRAEVPTLDIVIDDGGHQFDQQATSLEELLPHLRPGGVYFVEDHHGVRNRFGAYVNGLVAGLNHYRGIADHTNPERRKVSHADGFQSEIDSIHSYPFATVIEKRSKPVGEFVSPKHGTDWEPFLS